MNIHKHALALCVAFSAVGHDVANCKLVNGALPKGCETAGKGRSSLYNHLERRDQRCADRAKGHFDHNRWRDAGGRGSACHCWQGTLLRGHPGARQVRYCGSKTAPDVLTKPSRP